MTHLYFISYFYTARATKPGVTSAREKTGFGNITIRRDRPIDSSKQIISVTEFIKNDGSFDGEVVNLAVLNIILLNTGEQT